MRSRILPVVGVSVAALALATSFASMADAHSTGVSASHKGAASALKVAPAAGSTCFSNLKGTAPNSITSQNFEKAFVAVDGQGVDDFKLKKTCKVTEVDVLGVYYNATPGGPTGPADSENVFIYKNKKGNPGALISKQQKLVGTDNAGSFNITLKKPVTLKKGTYWVSVQANQNLETAGQWGWDDTATQKGAPAQWQNPGDGFGTGCTSYANMQTCLGLTGQPDFMFAILK